MNKGRLTSGFLSTPCPELTPILCKGKDGLAEYMALFSKEVTDLYLEYSLCETKFFDTFDNTARLINVAIKLGRNDGKSHFIGVTPTTTVALNFLNDTLDYVMDGKDRCLDHAMWRNMIISSPPGDKMLLKSQAKRHEITQIVYNWLRRPGGADDLMLTFYCIYGAHNLKHIASKSGHALGRNKLHEFW